MLVTLNEILELAEAGGYAVGSFNTPNLESVMAVVEAAEELNVPVIIQHAQGHEEIMPLSIIGPIMLEFAKKAKVPVCVHLDHGESLNYLNQALQIGFTSVMYDGSNLSFKENAANTKFVVNLAKKTGASVEAEIGHMGRRETGSGDSSDLDDDTKIYTNPEEAKLFAEETGIDALACSFGTTHGIYMSTPKLDFSIIENVRKKAKIPVVMHGGSGVSDDDFRTAINKGVRKINYYTYMAIAGGVKISEEFYMGCQTVENKGKKYHFCYSLTEVETEKPIYYHDIVSWGVSAMKENVKKAMKVFSMK